MGEEGPEPQELLEHVEHSLHEKHGEHEGSESGEGEHGKPGTMKNKHMRSAITAAILAVFAALGSLLSGHAANEAILLQSKASDQWTYYQAKSTKGHLYEVNKTLVEALMQVRSESAFKRSTKHTAKVAGGSAGTIESTESTAASPLAELTKSIDAKMKGYDKEKQEIQDKATDLEKESQHEFAAHQMYSFAVACFQICIVLASVSILVDSTALFQFSVFGGIIGVGLLIFGFVR